MYNLKTKRTVITLTIITLAVFATGCASFRTKYQVDQNIILTKKNISKINKTFSNVPVSTVVKYNFSPQKTTIPDSLNDHYLVVYIKQNRQNGTNQKIDTETTVRILVRDKSKISFYTLKKGFINDSVTFKYKLKKDGFLYIKDSNFEINNVPFIYGGFEINRTRLGLNKNDELIFESSYYIYGAVLVIIGDDRKYKSSSLFRKIE